MFEATSASAQHRPLSAARREQLSPVESCTFWGKLFDQRWLRVFVPDQYQMREDLWLHLEDQSEATLYVEGLPYWGFDVAHRRCRLPRGVQELWIECLCVQSAIWHSSAKPFASKGALFNGVWIEQRDDTAWHAYYDLQCLVELLWDLRRREDPKLSAFTPMFGQQDSMDRCHPVYRILLSSLDKALDELDRGGPSAMRPVLAEVYDRLRDRSAYSCAVLTGHAHIDLVWLWPERIGEAKAVHTFATVNRLMEEYPEFRFAYSQPASYEAVRRREPALYNRVQSRMSSGQWQATGALYVESDTMLPCGEALSRSFELGQKALLEIRGEPSPLCWLPDVFGFCACLPQLMRLHGVEYFYTTKLQWNAVNRFPHSSFVWRGSDGSEVLAHLTQDVGYVTSLRVHELKSAMYANRQAHVHQEFLFPTGYGDGGGGPTAGMCERARRLDALHSLPSLTWEHPEVFFQRLNMVRAELPVYQGECYLEAHRGVFTTHSEVKSAYRALERTLQIAEAAASRTGSLPDLERYWKRAVFFQFHDYIPGSSVWDVYSEGLKESQDLVAQINRITLATLSAAGGREECYFNPHVLPVAVINKDGCFQIPGLAGAVLSDDVRLKVEPVRIEKYEVSNGLASFCVDDQGYLTSLTFPEGRSAISECFGALAIAPDHAAEFDAWEIDRHILTMLRPCHDVVSLRTFRDHDFRAGVEVERRLSEKSRAVVRYILESGRPELLLEVTVDWADEEHLLKLILPTYYRARHARFGAPFGSVLRAQTPESLAAEAQWEVPFSRHLAVFEEGERYGLCVVSESTYGATVHDGVVGLTLLRSPLITGRDGRSDAWPAHLSRLENPPRCADIGRRVLRFAIGAYCGDMSVTRLPAVLAETLFTPPLPYRGTPMETPFKALTLSSGVAPAWVKPLAAGGWLVRFHETLGRSGQIQMSCNTGFVATASSHDGRNLSDPAQEVTIPVGPQKIVTVRFLRKS